MAEREHIHFVTGRLAEPSLREILQRLATDVDFDWSIGVLPITVAALMTTRWVAEKVAPPPETTQLLLPGYCSGKLAAVQDIAAVRVRRGPKDLRELPRYFGHRPPSGDYGSYDIEIIAEINHCPRLSVHQLIEHAGKLSEDGADLIDVGCIPGETWSDVGTAIRTLREAGHRVSIDSLNPREIELAVDAGAELVLSVNRSNRRLARDWGVEVVVIPDHAATLEGFDETIDYLQSNNVQIRLDPVLEPIGFGMAASLGRYIDARRKYPSLPMMMGIGNVTELTDADSAAINVVLLGICQELRIGSVLTTQVINWARSTVRECDLARRLVHYAVSHQQLPKHVEPRLIPLRGETPVSPTYDELAALAHSLKDRNYRVYTAEGEIHLVSGGLHLHHHDAFAVMEKLLSSDGDSQRLKGLDAGHAFYLGYECCKAATALALSKQYRQDEALDWGYLTRAESHHHLASRRAHRNDPGGTPKVDDDE